MSKGLGDIIEHITEATGIKYIVEKTSGKRGCKCKERKRKLNEQFPYNRSLLSKVFNKENKNV